MGQRDEPDTTMGSGGIRNTAERAAPRHPGSRLIRERIQPPGGATIDDVPDKAEGGDSGDDEGKGGDA